MSNKENIQQAALELFSEQGYDRTPTSQIARAAKVSEGLIFRHFGNKAGLLNAIIQAGMAQIADTMRSYSEVSAAPRSAILQHIDQALTAIQTQEKFWQLVTKIRFQAAVSEVAGAEIERVNQFVVHQLTENFRRMGVPAPELEALGLFAMIDGICLHWLQNPQAYPIGELKSWLIQLYSSR